MTYFWNQRTRRKDQPKKEMHRHTFLISMIYQYDRLWGSDEVFSTGVRDLPQNSNRRKRQARGFKYIVIHHTATRNMTAEQMRLSMRRTWIDNKGNDHIPAHYIIGSDWSLAVWEDINMPVGAVTLDKYNNMDKVNDANFNWIHIELVGDFNKNKPSKATYISLQNKVRALQKKYPGIQIRYHQDFQNKNCPWVLFDRNFMSKNYKGWEVVFSLSRYYSVISWQKRYYGGKRYEDDTIMNCWKNAINTDACLYPADGKILTNADKNKSVACPKEYPLGTRIDLEWVGIVTCRDRGGAIVNNRLDMYCGIGDYALDNRESCKTGNRKGIVLGK